MKLHVQNLRQKREAIMTENKTRFSNVAEFDLPSTEHVFASAPMFRHFDAPANANDKVAGGGDSVHNQKTTVKAPGGHDASRQKDGG
jgi:hypothetical protein